MPFSHQRAWLQEVAYLTNRVLEQEAQYPRLVELKAAIRAADADVKAAFAEADEVAQRAALSAEEKACMDLIAYADSIRLNRS